MHWRSYVIPLLVLISVAVGFPMDSIRTVAGDNIKTIRAGPVHFIPISPAEYARAQAEGLMPNRAPDNGAVVSLELAPQDFTLLVTPYDLEVCTPAEAIYTVEVGQIAGSTDPVTISASYMPDGTTVGFSVNPVIPPGMSTMTIGNTGAAPAGNFTIQIIGTSTSSWHDYWVGLTLRSMPPPQTVLIAPSDGESNVPLQPLFKWYGDSTTTTRHLQLARDELFTDIVLDVAGLVSYYTSPVILDTNTLYYWQVTGHNACGEGVPSEVFHFTTIQLHRIYLPLTVR